MDLLCDTHDDSSSVAQEHCSCTVISIHFITHGSGAVAMIRFACPCTAEELSVIWLCGGRCGSRTGGCETVGKTPCVQRKLSRMECFEVLSSSRTSKSWHIRCLRLWIVRRHWLTQSQSVCFPRRTHNSRGVCRFCWHKSCLDLSATHDERG